PCSCCQRRLPAAFAFRPDSRPRPQDPPVSYRNAPRAVNATRFRCVGSAILSAFKRPGKMSSPLREGGDGADERAAVETVGRDWAGERGEADDAGGGADLRPVASTASSDSAT